MCDEKEPSEFQISSDLMTWTQLAKKIYVLRLWVGWRMLMILDLSN
jgi:hypothetical protein